MKVQFFELKHNLLTNFLLPPLLDIIKNDLTNFYTCEHGL